MCMKRVLWLIWMIGLSTGCNLNRLQEAKDSLDEHDLANAERLYRRVLEEDSSNIEALAGLGWTYHLALKKEDALAQFTHCLTLEPENIDCLRGKSSVILSQGDGTQARIWLDKALRIDDDDPEVLVTDAIWKLSQGEISKASRQLGLVVQRFPKEGRYRLPYGEALLKSGNPELALQEVQTALQLTVPRRTRAMLWILRARLLLEMSARAGEDCSQLKAIQQWVVEAERSLTESTSTGVEVPNSGMIHRQLERRRTTLSERCPTVLKEDERQ